MPIKIRKVSAMKPILIILVVGIVIRNILDLMSINREYNKINFLYALVFFIIGIALFFQGTERFFSWACFFVAFIYMCIGIYKQMKRTSQSGTK